MSAVWSDRSAAWTRRMSAMLLIPITLATLAVGSRSVMGGRRSQPTLPLQDPDARAELVALAVAAAQPPPAVAHGVGVTAVEDPPVVEREKVTGGERNP